MMTCAKNNINVVTFDLVIQFHTVVSFTDIKRLFSVFELVHHKTKKQIRHRKSFKTSNNFESIEQKANLIEHEY